MKARDYIIWIEAASLTIAKVVKSEDNKCEVSMPMCVINSPVGEDADGNPIAPTSPSAVKIHYRTNMIPYVFPEMVSGEYAFTLNLDDMKYSFIENDSNLAKQYDLILANLSQTTKA